ncbi:MAG TPA: DNA polymerase IV [Caulobacteraceae bacterium]
MSSLCRDCAEMVEPRKGRCLACGSPRIVTHPELDQLCIAHLDCDAFYASVEKRDRPELADQPVIVGGGVRGVVTTACYIARTFGVRSAMPMFKARTLCPQAVILPPDFRRYRAESARIMAALRELTPMVEPLSLDEAWLDLSGTALLHQAPAAVVLSRLQGRIEREIGLGVSIGLAPSKFLAKIASDLDKPRGFAVIGAAGAKAFLAPRPVSILPGVGPAFAKALTDQGFATVGDLARADAGVLAQKFGAGGLRLAKLAQGRDDRRVDPASPRKSISAETTFDEDLAAVPQLEKRLWPLCEKVARRARAEASAGRVVTLKLRLADFRIVTRRRTLGAATQTAKTLFAAGRALLRLEAAGAAYRLIGIGLSELQEAFGAPADLFGSEERRALIGERTADALRARFGDAALMSGRSLEGGAAGRRPR